MSIKIVKTGLAFVLSSLFIGAGAFAASGASLVTPDGGVKVHLFPAPPPSISAFKLKAGGQFDLSTGTATFAGQATHLGQFTATATLDPATLAIQGTMTANNEDSLNFSATFEPQPSGEIAVHMRFVGGPGRLFNATGEAFGTLALDADFMFALDLEGTFRKCERDVTRSCE
jgi:hypothetical protein